MADPVQALEIRRAEVAAELSGLVASDDLDAKGRERVKELTALSGELEERWLGAKAAEKATAAPDGPVTAGRPVGRPVGGPVGNLPSVDREMAELRSKVSLGRFIEASVEQRSLDGAEAEYASATVPDAPAGRIPLDLLEERATETGDITADANTAPDDTLPTNYRPALRRVFQTPVTTMLGIDRVNVSTGQSVQPVITAGASPTMLAEGADDTTEDDLEMTIIGLPPIRLSAWMSLSEELSLQLPGVSEMMRRDLSASFNNEMERQILTGNGTAPNVRGLGQEVTRPAVPGASTTFQEAINLATSAWDGQYAATQRDIAVVGPMAAVRYLDGLYQTTTTEMSAFQILQGKLRGIMGSAHLPDAGGSGRTTTSDLFAVRTAGGISWAYMPVWNTFSIQEDRATLATQGRRRYIATAYWNFRVSRSDCLVPLVCRTSG